MTRKEKVEQTAVLDLETNVLTVTFWEFIANNGDGSCSSKHFNSESDAEEFARPDEERNCEDVNRKTIKIDMNTGMLIDTPVRETGDW